MKKLIVTLVATFLLSTTAHAKPMSASWYGYELKGRKTASGELFDPMGLTAAHKTLPFGTCLDVSYNGKSVRVTVNDRGPFVKGRELDLSKGAAQAIAMEGIAVVDVEVCQKGIVMSKNILEKIGIVLFFVGFFMLSIVAAKASPFNSFEDGIGLFNGRSHLPRTALGAKPARWCGWYMRSQKGGGPEYNKASVGYIMVMHRAHVLALLLFGIVHIITTLVL